MSATMEREEARTGAPATARKRIVIVDESEIVLEVLQEFLSAGYDVDVAATPAAALRRIGSNPPDLILLDVDMPGIGGRTLLEAFHLAGAPVPVFAMARYDRAALADKAKQNGAAAFLLKPVELRDLDALIAETLGVSPFLQ